MPVEQQVELKKGLRNVFFDRTQTGSVDPAGKLHYRGYSIHDLAQYCTFEEACYLLLHGSLPTARQLSAFDSQLKQHRRLPAEILEIIRLTKTAHPMDVLRTSISAMSGFDPEVSDTSTDATLEKGTRLISATASVAAAHARIRDGKEAVEPDEELGHAANFLYMLFGARPSVEDARLIDKDFVLHAEHGVNASTFAARVAAATQADYYAAITAGISTLKGPKHGGAAESVMQMSLEIGSEANAEAYVAKILDNGGRVMGFGHPVYRAVDPRAIHLRADAKALGERKGQPKWFSIIEAVTETKAMKERAKKGLHPNVDLWSGAIYYLLDIPEDLFVPMFALGRIPGWTAHIIEQYSKKDILRPRLLYDGPLDLTYVPIEQRS